MIYMSKKEGWGPIWTQVFKTCDLIALESLIMSCVSYWCRTERRYYNSVDLVGPCVREVGSQ